MVIKMNKRKLALIISVAGIFVLVFVATVMELNRIQKEKEYNYALNTIETATIKCINDSKCEMGKITLKELKDKKYLEDIKNPNTNEFFSDESYMVYPDLSFYEM